MPVLADFDGGRAAGERRLCLAILEDAIGCVLGTVPSRHRADALAWIMDDRVDYIFAFIPICDLLGIQPSALRRVVLWPCTMPPAPVQRLAYGRRRRAPDAARLIARASEGWSLVQIARYYRVPQTAVSHIAGPTRREYVLARNVAIRARHRQGESVPRLAMAYALAKSSVKRIVETDGCL